HAAAVPRDVEGGRSRRGRCPGHAVRRRHGRRGVEARPRCRRRPRRVRGAARGQGQGPAGARQGRQTDARDGAVNAPASLSVVNPAKLLREQIRAGRHTTVTTGLAPGHLQANLVILPADWADEFAAFCAANPKPCPLIAQSEPGDPRLPVLGRDIDVRTDLPRYRVFRDGVAVSEETDISALWRHDLVAFALGCSYSFEAALLEAGVPIRHIEQGKKVCTYRTGPD